MAAARTWFKIAIALIGLGTLGMCAIAGAGVYFVRQHVDTRRVSTSSAMEQFDEALARFKDQKPVIEIDAEEQVRKLRDLGELPTAPAKVTDFVVMAWDPDEGRIVNLRLPLWILTMGQRKVDLGIGAESLDLRRLQLNLEELSRVGPQLILDLRTRTGERVVLWTE